MSTETLTRTVSPNKAKKSILRAFNKKRPIFLWGPPGIGKSEIVGQINDQVLKNSFLIDIRLSLWEPTDIKGIPYLVISIGTTWAIYGLLRKKINVSPSIGLLYETFVISLISIPYIIYIFQINHSSFFSIDIKPTTLLILTGIVT